MIEWKTTKEEKVEQMVNWRRAKVESLRWRLRRAVGRWRRGEGTGGLGSLAGGENSTEQTAGGTRG